MTRRSLFLSLACAAGVAATVAATIAATSPEFASPLLQASGPASVAATVAPANRPPDQVRWLARYGTYNARQGSWNLLPPESWRDRPNPDRC